MHRSFSLLILLAMSIGARAEDGCPAGQIPARAGLPDDLSRCVEAPASLPPRPSDGPRWEDRWGTIAIDGAKTNVGLGVATGMKSKRQAERAALKDCRAKGGAGCEVSLSYHNQCAVVVAGIGYSVSRSAENVEEASATGLEECGEAGISSCTLYYSACSPAERVR